MRLEFELVRDFTPVMVTCKFYEDLIKNEVVIIFTTSRQLANNVEWSMPINFQGGDN